MEDLVQCKECGWEGHESDSYEGPDYQLICPKCHSDAVIPI